MIIARGAPLSPGSVLPNSRGVDGGLDETHTIRLLLSGFDRDEAIEALASHDDAKLMAGGQSLMPMLNFRVVRPSLIIDISKLVELDYVRESSERGLTIGVLTRHRVLETSEKVARRFPIIPETMHNVAHLAIRNRGTIGGSLSHADPAAELPMLMHLLDATIIARSKHGERAIAASDFFVAPLTTSLREGEMVVRIELPGLPAGMGWCFQEVARRAGDVALAAVGVLLDVQDGLIPSLPERCAEPFAPAFLSSVEAT